MSLFRRRKVNRRVAPAAPRRRLPVRTLLLSVGFIAAMGGAAWGAGRLADPAVMPVRYVRISGDLVHLDAAMLRDEVRAALRGNFITADTDGIRRRLAALPWIRSVSVSRVWPDSLSIAVEERRAVGRWARGGLISDEGVVFRPEGDSGAQGLPLLQGPAEDAADIVAAYRRVGEAVAPLGLRVTRLKVDGRHAWRLTLDNGIDVVLGREAFARRLDRLTRIYAPVVAPRAGQIQEVDLRYSNGFAVHWRNDPSA